MAISSVKARNRKLVISVCKKRCALNPAHPGSHVHEIIPRSLKRDWWVLGNQVLLCPACHDKIHREGTKNYVDKLTGLIWEKLLRQVHFQELIKMIVS
jgi:5-methylcytosine-specific restriction endonuclease McrA